MRTRRAPNRVPLAKLLMALPLLTLAACHSAVLDPQGAVGLAEKTILIDSLGIMLAIVIPVIVAIFAFAWWFRASNTRAQYLPGFVYSGQLELVLWGIPLLTIILLGGVAFIGSHQLDPARPLESKAPALEVQVVSLDWKWLFIYPGLHVASVNQLVIPAGTAVHFTLTSASVMNTFFIPQLGSMIYTMNAMADQLNLIADHPGTFRGLSGHLSGDGFSDMHFDVRAVSPADFQAWAAATGGEGDTLNSAAYQALARQSVPAAPFTYRDVDAGLFQRIVAQLEAPGPGPDSGRPNRDVSPKTGH